MNLYELKENYLKLQELIESGDFTEEELADTLEMINDSIELKAEGYAKIIKMQEGNINTLKAEIERLASRKSSLENSIDKLKDNLKQAMIDTGKEKIKTDLFSISVANNPPAVKVIDETVIPKEYYVVKTTETLNKTLLKDILKSGQTIEGVELTQGKGLRIK
jgi:predicted RNase H-like nuclease (RuvC/YqgF family)